MILTCRLPIPFLCADLYVLYFPLFPPDRRLVPKISLILPSLFTVSPIILTYITTPPYFSRRYVSIHDTQFAGQVANSSVKPMDVISAIRAGFSGRSLEFVSNYQASF